MIITVGYNFYVEKVKLGNKGHGKMLLTFLPSSCTYIHAEKRIVSDLQR